MKNCTILFLVLFLSVFYVNAETAYQKVNTSVSGFEIDPDFNDEGVAVKTQFNLGKSIFQTDTSFYSMFRIGWPSASYYRTEDGEFLNCVNCDGINIDEDIEYKRLHLEPTIGLIQDLGGNNFPSNSISAFLLYRARFDRNFENSEANQLFFNQTNALLDKEEIFQNSALAGLYVDTVYKNPIGKSLKGFYGEVAAESAPAFANSISDYVKLSMTLNGYLPLFNIVNSQNRHVFSMYIADYVGVDYVFGNSIPVNTRQLIGGLDPRYGMGGTVRGIAETRYDSVFKAVNSFEVRMNLPPIFHKDLVPGIMAGHDIGYWAGVDTDKNGWLNTSSAAVYLEVMDITQVMFYMHYLWDVKSLNGDTFIPFDFSIGFHF